MKSYRPQLNNYEEKDPLWWCRHHKENSIYLSKVIIDLSEQTDMETVQIELLRHASITAKNILKHDIRE